MEILLLIFIGLTAFFFFKGKDKSTNVHSSESEGHSESYGESDIMALASPSHASRRRVRRTSGNAVGLIESLVEASAMAVGTMVAVAAVAVGTIIIGTGVAAYATASIIRSTVEKYWDAHGAANPDRERAYREREIRDINSEIDEYERKRHVDGSLNEYAAHELEDLHRRRSEESVLLEGANSLIIANRMADGSESYDNMHVSDVNTHVLQFHVGQTVFGKTCGRCGMPMILQWMRKLETVRMVDFFWGCAGFFDGKCRNTEPFRRSDMVLFTRTDREEFSINSKQLSSIIRLPQSANLVSRRVGQIVNLPNSTYYCPIHHEPMVLRQKNRPESLLDMYFYGCPRWRPTGPTCKQIVKLKSAGQLSAALETMTGKGIL